MLNVLQGKFRINLNFGNMPGKCFMRNFAYWGGGLKEQKLLSVRLGSSLFYTAMPPQSSRPVPLENDISGEKGILSPSSSSLWRQLFYDCFQMFPAISLLPAMKFCIDPVGKHYILLMPLYWQCTLLDTHPSLLQTSPVSEHEAATGCRRSCRRRWKERKTSCTANIHIIYPETTLASELLSCCKE